MPVIDKVTAKKLVEEVCVAAIGNNFRKVCSVAARSGGVSAGCEKGEGVWVGERERDW